MIGEQQTGVLKGITISAVAHEDLRVNDQEGNSLMLAVIDQNGNIIASGQAVAREVRSVSINCYRNFLKGSGYIRVFSANEPLNDAQASAMKRAA